VVRDRSSLARIVDDGHVENVYRLQIMNATESAQRYRVAASGLPGLALQAPADVALAPAEARWVTVELRLPPEAAAQAGSGAHTVHFDIERLAGADQAPRSLHEKSTFVVPG
jgi:polyferredoxin